MRWDIEDKIRAHIVGFSGINFSGERWEADIWPMGGLQKDDLDGRRLKSIGIIAPVGTRMILITAGQPDNWDQLPYRCVQVLEGFTFEARDGKRVGVQIPDLDRMDAPHLTRVQDPDTITRYPHVERFEDGRGWTFGRTGGIELKSNIRAIRVEKFDPKDYAEGT